MEIQISILPVFGKILEAVMKEQLVRFLEIRNMSSPTQETNKKPIWFQEKCLNSYSSVIIGGKNTRSFWGQRVDHSDNEQLK